MRQSSRDRFVRLAEQRVNSALKIYRLIGNLSNRSNYSFTDEDVDKIFRALERELRKTKERFKAKDGKGSDTFTLG